MRSASVLACTSLFMLAASAQWNGGPLTIIATPAFPHPHAGVLSDRGGAPPNDQCQNAVVTPLGPGGTATITGDNTGSTDTEDFGNPNCWEAFSIDTCSTVTVSYCSTDPAFGLVYSILIMGCPGDVSVQNSDTSACADGNVSIIYEDLAAGTYYIPVLMVPGTSEGPYTITLTTTPCALPPSNDLCANAVIVPVVIDCSEGTTAGNNALAQQQGSVPGCTSTNSQIQDVWYGFNSGANNQVTIALGLGTIGDVGIDVKPACGTASIFCGTGDTSYTFNVTPGSDYRFRVFSNNDFGLGGSFTVCVAVPAEEDECDGGHVSLLDGGDSVLVCADEPPIPLFFSTASASFYTFVLATEYDTIVSVLPGSQLDILGLTPGTYHVWGVSHLSTLLGDDPGAPVDSLYSLGTCVELSATPLVVVVDICAAVPESAGWTWEVRIDDAGIRLLWQDRAMALRADLFNAQGALVGTRDLRVERGSRVGLLSRAGMTPGCYTLRLSGAAHQETKRLLVH